MDLGYAALVDILDRRDGEYGRTGIRCLQDLVDALKWFRIELGPPGNAIGVRMHHVHRDTAAHILCLSVLDRIVKKI